MLSNSHNPVDEEGIYTKVNKSNKSTQYTHKDNSIQFYYIVIQKTAHSYLFTVEPERKVMCGYIRTRPPPSLAITLVQWVLHGSIIIIILTRKID